MKLKITRVEAMPPAGLRVTWGSGKQREVDVGEYLQAPGHERLRDGAFFAAVQVEEWGHGVEWPAAERIRHLDSRSKEPKGRLNGFGVAEYGQRSSLNPVFCSVAPETPCRAAAGVGAPPSVSARRRADRPR